MKSSLLLLIAFPVLVSCNTPDVAPKEKTKVEAPQTGGSYTQSPMVGHYVKISNESSLFLPKTIDIEFVEKSHQILLNENAFELAYTGNAAYLRSSQDLAFAPRSLKSVEILHDWQRATTGDDTYRVVVTYWGNDIQSQTTSWAAEYKKSL
jgi:hypothetical protein